MNRRQFITAIGASFITLGAPHLFAAPASSPRFLLVFLRGAYDCNHLLVPHTSDFYYEARPRISIPAPNASDPNSSIYLDPDWALAPSLKESLLPLWEKGQLAFIPFAGTEDISRSHFKTQDSIEAGWPIGSSRSYASGFMGRLANQLNEVKAASFTNTAPAVFRGHQTPNISLRRYENESISNSHYTNLLLQLYKSNKYKASVEEGIALSQQARKQFQAEMDSSAHGAPDASSFEKESRRIAGMMRENFRLGFVEVGGWDTHVDQGDESGPLAKKLSTLGQGLSAFADALGEQEWNNTVVVVLSEFGRTFRENGNRGTDHGHGTVYWVLGGNINGRKIIGPQVKVSPESLLQQRDYPVLSNYRNILGSIFQPLWGFKSSQISSLIFPDYKHSGLHIL